MRRNPRGLGSLHPTEEEPESLAATSLDRDQQWELYRFMKLNRLLEETTSNLFRRGKIVGGSYASRGQEATSVGSTYALESRDFIGPMIRNLGAELVRGLTPREYFCLHMARDNGANHSKDNLPPTDLARGIVGPIAMLAALIPVMSGVALAGRMLGKDLVALTWTGDGGSSVGDFHEGLNMAAVLSLPLVLIVENNGYAYSTPTAKQMRIKDIAIRAAGYGIPGEIVDGNDVLAVYEVTRKAVARARAGGGPVLIESKTFRMRGHAEHDDASYVPDEVISYWEARDPIARFERHLLRKGFATEEDCRALGEEIQAGLDADVEFALASPLPDGELALQGAYAPLDAPIGPPAAAGAEAESGEVAR